VPETTPPGTVLPSGQAVGGTGNGPNATSRIWMVQVAEPFPFGTGVHGSVGERDHDLLGRLI
jgi:hypothetical protein